jgi:DNA (cytosine-5)-methyltransferase 1
VFVVGYLGDWRVAAAVLFERESLQGNIKPSRKKREEVASDAEGSVGEAGDVSCVGGNLSPTVTSKWMKGYGGPSGSNETGNMVYAPTVIDRAAFNQGENAQYEPRIEAGETMSSLVARGPHAVAQPIGINGNIAGTIDANYFKGCGSANFGERDVVAQPIAVDTYNYTTNDHTTQTIRSQSDTEHIGAVLQLIAVDVYNQSIDGQTSATITEAVGGTNTSGPKVMHSMAIRRLTPKECERLQGFPDDWTKIPYRNKPADQCPDGPRYKACGNSMAVPVMRWIGQRIQYVESLMKEL